MPKEKTRGHDRTRIWSAVVYPDSAPENWREVLDDLHIEWVESPLHEFDTNPTGEVKKAHWHIIVKTDARTSFKDMNETLNSITKGPMPQKCLSLKGSFEYLTHLNNPERYQGYDKPETFNGFTIEPNEHDKKLMLQEIMRVCQDEKLESYAELIRRYIDSPEYLNIISVKAYALKSMVDDNWKRTHQDYAKRIEVVNWWKEGEIL